MNVIAGTRYIRNDGSISGVLETRVINNEDKYYDPKFGIMYDENGLWLGADFEDFDDQDLAFSVSEKFDWADHDPDYFVFAVDGDGRGHIFKTVDIEYIGGDGEDGWYFKDGATETDFMFVGYYDPLAWPNMVVRTKAQQPIINWQAYDPAFVAFAIDKNGRGHLYKTNQIYSSTGTFAWMFDSEYPAKPGDFINIGSFDCVNWESSLILRPQIEKHVHYDLITQWAANPELELYVQAIPNGPWERDRYPTWRSSYQYRIGAPAPTTKYFTMHAVGGDMIFSAVQSEDISVATPHVIAQVVDGKIVSYKVVQ